MDSKILVAYASKKGATAEIAERVGSVLRQAGFAVDVQPVENAGDPARYQAVVLGSAAYYGRWRKKAAVFLRANEKALAGRPVWLFSSGPTTEGDPQAFMNKDMLPLTLKPVADRIKPRGVAVFHGDLDVNKLNFFEKFVIKKVKAPVGDFRDWAKIEAWAGDIARELAQTITSNPSG